MKNTARKEALLKIYRHRASIARRDGNIEEERLWNNKFHSIYRDRNPRDINRGRRV